MQLEPGERSVLSYFPTSSAAQRAARQLQEAGIKTTQVDRVSRYGAKTDENYNNPINHAVTVTGPTLFSDSTGGDMTDSERILRGADPSVSGYGSPDYGAAGGKAFLLTVVTTEDKLDQAVGIIEKNEGYV